MLEPSLAFAVADRIAQLTLDGLTAAEIARDLGLTHKQVLRAAARRQPELQPRGGARLVGARIPPAHYAVIRRLAETAEVSPAVMLARIAGCILAEGPQGAVRRLGKAARPKRGYQRRA